MNILLIIIVILILGGFGGTYYWGWGAPGYSVSSLLLAILVVILCFSLFRHPLP